MKAAGAEGTTCRSEGGKRRKGMMGADLKNSTKLGLHGLDLTFHGAFLEEWVDEKIS